MSQRICLGLIANDLEQSRQIQQEQNRNRKISDSLVTLPQQLLEARQLLFSANNRQEIARLRIELFKKRYQKIDQEFQQPRNHLNFQR